MLRSYDIHDYWEHCVEMRSVQNISLDKSRDFATSFNIWVTFVRFVRGASGPFAKAHKTITDESLAEVGIALFGSGPPKAGAMWPTCGGDVGKFENFLRDLLKRLHRRVLYRRLGYGQGVCHISYDFACS